jgi:pantoate--beta-alanine ligase
MMETTKSIEQTRAVRWSSPDLQWGLVPTMGYLHEGHLSLVRRAREENDRVAVSIFVNPTQFAPGEDLAVYPRNIERDLELLRSEKVDLVFIPAESQMYPAGFQTTVSVDQVSRPLEGAARPTHFRGVSTVVAKLFNIFQPRRAYFGQKDAQQVVVIRRMVMDLNINLELVVCPIVREADGLAMSSRNVRLSQQQRAAATVLHRALVGARERIASGETDGDILRMVMAEPITAEPLARLDYVSVSDPDTLEELDIVSDKALLSGAVFFGDVRLIDNILLN